jgi:hypothetical protein
VTRCVTLFHIETSQQSAVNRLVAGSNPARGAKRINYLAGRPRPEKPSDVRYKYGTSPRLGEATKDDFFER